VDNLTPDEVLQLLEAPVTIYAPEGTTFRLRRFLNPDATTEQISEPAELMHRMEVRGPDDEDHLWLATWDGEFTPMLDDSIPERLTVLAQIAVTAWLDWENWFSVNAPGG
jgi:hypothetical protein